MAVWYVLSSQREETCEAEGLDGLSTPYSVISWRETVIFSGKL